MIYGITVNLPNAEIHFTEEELVGKEPDEAIDMVTELYPDWTSLVITVVRKA